MKIFIFGTKGGARPLYPKEGVAPVFDDCRSFGKDNPIGNLVYSLEYTKSGVALSKWIVIDDTIRDSIGFLSFALEIANYKTHNSKKAIEVLDSLVNEYNVKYLSDKFEISNLNEDWSFVERIKQKYQQYFEEIKDEIDIEKYSAGEKDSAYIYYSSEEELQNYFDAPYMEEYKPYKRIFFVDKKYENKDENPLNALRHDESANLTSLNLLENIRYRIIVPEARNGISAHITTADGQEISNKDKVHPNDELNISFKRDNYERLHTRF